MKLWRREASIERQVRRELRRIAFWRIMVAFTHLPGDLLKTIGMLLQRVAEAFESVSASCFMFELEAARRYRSLTGIDLGYAVRGDISRYGGLNPKALAKAEQEEFGEEDE